MKNNLLLAILALLIAIVLSIFSKSSYLVSIFSSDGVAGETVENEVVFSIPLGNDGINFEGNNSSDMLTWGPSALAVAPDGTFWIADAAGNRLLHYNSAGLLLEKINVGDFVVGVGDLEVTEKQLGVLDMASIPPKGLSLSLGGEIQKIYDLPKGLYLEDGLS